MRIFSLLVSAFIAAGVVALNEAIPAELLWLYSIYTAEYKVIPAENRKIAPGCVHNAANFPPNPKNPNPASAAAAAKAEEAAFLAEVMAAGLEAGICAFDEFVKYVGTRQSFRKWEYDKAGHTINPTWGRTRTKAAAAAHQDDITGPDGTTVKEEPIKLLMDFDQLFPGLFTGRTQPWADAVKEGSTRFQAVREAAPDDSFVKGLVSKAQAYIKFAHQVRLKDGAAFFKTRLVAFLQQLDTAFATRYLNALRYKETVINPPGGTTRYGLIVEVDYEATVAALGPGTTIPPDFQRNLNDMNTAFAESEQTVAHNDVIEAMHEHTDSLATDPTVCAARKRSITTWKGVRRRLGRAVFPPHHRHLQQPIRMPTLLK
ncbi:hypothetical protein F5Y03DRAFT_62339 [Xylaria venustula]|nr:hypothetical protein F5Y03DRAFT_62339 [Xylaria venustula]